MMLQRNGVTLAQPGTNSSQARLAFAPRTDNSREIPPNPAIQGSP